MNHRTNPTRYTALVTGLLLGLLCGLPTAGLASTDTAVAVPLPVTTGQSAPKVIEWHKTRTFRELGTQASLPLRGGGSSTGVGFGVRNDELVTGARLQLSYIYSPSVIENLSHIKVYLNEEVVGILPMPKKRAGERIRHELSLDPLLVTDYNQLRMELIGHYTLEHCEDEQHSSLWADISGSSKLDITVRPLPVTNELGIFPEPFFDRRDFSRLVLPVVFAYAPSDTTLEAAGAVTSWFGGLADWRGARFPVSLGNLPNRHAIIFASNQQRPAFLRDYPLVDRPTIAVVSRRQLYLPGDEDGEDESGNAINPYSKYLLILGRDDAQLKTAAHALVLGQAVLSGEQVVVESVDIGPERAPYDAPKWIRLDRPTKFGELVNSPGDLQVSGHRPEIIRVNLRLPADLFTWRSRGVPVDLNYRYTPLIEQDESRLNVSINEEFVEAFNLRESGKGGIKKRVRVPLLEDGLFGSQNQFYIPAFKVGSNNQLQFDFSFARHKKSLCGGNPIDNVRAAIDADSSIDFSGFPHFAALPNLGFFANSGFPFTRRPDLADSTLVLPSQPSRHELEAVLTVLGNMGISTGYPATRVQVRRTDQIEGLKQFDRELLLIGRNTHETLTALWQEKLPTGISRLGRELGLPKRAVNLLHDWLGFGTDPDPSTSTEVMLESNGPLGMIIGFESPLQPGRSVVSLIGERDQDLQRLLSALGSSDEVRQMHGSTVLLRDNGIESLLVGDVYTVGDLPLKDRIWYFLSNHPVILVTLTLLSLIIVAFLLWRALRVIVAMRVHEQAR